MENEIWNSEYQTCEKCGNKWHLSEIECGCEPKDDTLFLDEFYEAELQPDYEVIGGH